MTQASRISREQVVAALRRATELAADLQTLLQEESEIMGGDPVALEALASRKHALVTELEAVSAPLSRPRPGGGQSASIAAWLASGADPKLGRAWTGLTDILATCSTLNARNGSAIRALSHYTDRLLAIVQGTGSGESVYDHGGRSRPVAATRYATRA